jgi:hypothetical protein
MKIDIDLPNLGTPFEWAGIEYLLAREFGRQFHELVDSRFKEHNVITWFNQIMDRRIAANMPKYDDPSDPRFLLKEAIFKHSEIRLVVPEVQDNWDEPARKLANTLNLWAHQKVNPTAEAFLDVLVKLETVSQGLGLDDFLEHLDLQIERTKQIKNGVWVPTGPTIEVPADATKYATEVVKKVEEVKQRPPVGHEWIGKPGERIVDLSKATRDVYEKGISIRKELGEDADEKITSWLRYYPQGGKLRIDTDGAVLGFKQGIGYLIGWLGEEPGIKKDEARGFYLSNEYEFVPTDIRDMSTGELLSKVALQPIDWILNELVLRNVPLGAVLNMTIYGDLVYITEAGNELKIAAVHKDVWFPGQLAHSDD